MLTKRQNGVIRPVLFATLFLCFITGCSLLQDKKITNEAEQLESMGDTPEQSTTQVVTESKSENNFINLDELNQRLIPDWQQIESDLHQSSKFVVGNSDFSLEAPITTTRKNIVVTLDGVKIFQIFDRYDATRSVGRIAIMKVSMTNRTNDVLQLTDNNLALVTEYNGQPIQPEIEAFPSQNGNLVHLLKENDGQIPPKATVEGFLVYHIDALHYRTMTANQLFQLEIGELRLANSKQIMETTLRLYIPASQLYVEQLIARQASLEDYLSTQFLVDKVVLMRQPLSDTLSHIDISVTMSDIEISDLTLKGAYFEETLPEYTSGEVAVSIKLAVSNDGDTVMAFDQPEVTLQFGHDAKIWHPTVIWEPSFFENSENPKVQKEWIITYVLPKDTYIKYYQRDPLNFNMAIHYTTYHDQWNKPNAVDNQVPMDIANNMQLMQQHRTMIVAQRVEAVEKRYIIEPNTIVSREDFMKIYEEHTQHNKGTPYHIFHTQ